MKKDFIGKSVEVLVAFSSHYADAGSVPFKYYGKLIDSDENYCKLLIEGIESMGFTGSTISKFKENGNIIINNNYIISIREL